MCLFKQMVKWKIKAPKGWYFKEWIEHETYIEVIYVDQYNIKHSFIVERKDK